MALKPNGGMVVSATRTHPRLPLSDHSMKEAVEACFALRSLERYQEEHEQECARLMKTKQGTPQSNLLVLMRRARGTVTWSLITELSTANDTSGANVLVKTVQSQLAVGMRHEHVQEMERCVLSSTSIHVCGYRLTKKDRAAWLQGRQQPSARDTCEQMGTPTECWSSVQVT